ncbi:hypothetical protein K438DRAFT_430486 [Mycena galopus ATCC 62051]|nr:hypothetical protein K438DRAFT_430486 [Mycena galopus ATCC 62051]
MADMVGIITGAVALLQTASQALKYFMDAYNAPKEQRKMLEEMSSLKPMLVELEKRVQANPSSHILAQMTKPLKAFETSMGNFAAKLSKGQKLPLQKRLTWSWIKKEGGVYLVEFERMKSSISIWLNMYTGDIIQDGHAAHQRQLDTAMHGHIMQWITTLNFFQRHQLIFETRQAGTGEWLLADTKFRDWVSNSGKVLWCRGIRTFVFAAISTSN